MILQKVRLAKLKTDDGRWDVSATDLKVGEEFWVQPTTLFVQEFIVKGSTQRQRILCVFTEEKHVACPIELLEYTNEFQVK